MLQITCVELGLNLKHLDLPQSKWKELANRIETLLKNQRCLLPQDPEIEAKARHYAAQIRQERLASARESIDNNRDSAVKADVQYEQVDINSMITSDIKTIGAEHVTISQMHEYGFDKILQGLDFTQKQIDYARMLIAGRMIHPGSERETTRWLCDTSGARELLWAHG